MPSNNLPKPNIPGQNNQNQPQATTSGVAPVANPSTNQVADSSNSSVSQQANPIFDSKKLEIPTPQKAFISGQQAPTTAQSIPGGSLSRENPAGTPPGVKVSAPEENLNKAVAPQVDLATADPMESISKDLSPATKANPAPPVTTARQMQPPSLRRMPAPNPVANLSLQQPTAAVNQTPPQSLNSAAASQATSSNPISNETGNTSVPQVTAASNPGNNSPKAEKKSAFNLGFLSKNSKKATNSANNNNKIQTPGNKKKLPLPAIIAGGVVVVLLLVLLITRVFSSSDSKSDSKTSDSANKVNVSQPVSLTYWGLWEDSQIIEEVIADFEAENPNVTIDYRKQSHIDYRERLQQAIESGNGPDIFRFHANWGVMLADYLAAMPSNIMTASEYQQTFYPVAYQQLQSNGQIFGIPLMYDGLALLYNKEMLKTANISVPSTWSELLEAADQLTVPSNTSERTATNITRGGLAAGNAGNVDHFSDILALLILQNGGDPADPTRGFAKDALTFYTNFVSKYRVWSDRLPNSTVAFAREEVAMIFAPSWRIHDIQNLNPDLDFGVTTVPQLDTANPVAWSSFWAEGVSDSSKNKEVAWAFLKYLSSPEVLRKFYADASTIRAFGEIYPRQDMAAELETDELLAPFLEDAQIADTWYLASFTHDNGVNDQMIQYYEEAVNDVLAGDDVETALETTADGVDEVLTKYGVQ
jgi:ABC-type glycerol-3-phosphate transport system substrate-binding protein